MDYPIWQVPYLGGAMVIALVAIIHVFIAHFAVGAGIFNALTETFALRRNEETLRQFLRDNSKLIILLPFIGGAVTGVGIWFSIALVSPDATGFLIHLFLWGWAIEWVFFLVEIVSGYVYYYSWGRISHALHCLLGWIYAAAAFLSLVVINGILSFMLSPAGLDSSQRPMVFDFWTALFNPTYGPSLVLRTISALALAALFAMVLVNAARKYNQPQRDIVVQHAGRYLLPLILMVPAAFWYFLRVPAQSIFYIKGGAIAMTLLFAFGLAASTLIGLYSYGAIILRRRTVNLETAVLLLAIALVATGSSEFVREGMRKPYLIWDHMYSNGMLKAQVPAMNAKIANQPAAQASALQFSRWAIQPNDVPPNDIQPNDTGMSDDDFINFDGDVIAELRKTNNGRTKLGRWLYNAQCLRCHTITGYNAMRPLVYDWSETMIDDALKQLDKVKPFMPPFVGSDADRKDLTAYLYRLHNPNQR